jgi:hypothetical protein
MASQDELLRQAIAQVQAKSTVDSNQPMRQLTAKAQVGDQPQAPEFGLLATAARKGLQGLSYGTADEAIAAGRAGLDAVGGKGFDYDQRLQEERNNLKAMDEQHPYISAGSEIVGNALSPVSKILAPVKGASVLANAARLGTAGAIQGFGEGEGGLGQRVSNAAFQGGAAGTVGALVGTAGKAYQAATSDKNAAKIAVKALGADNQTRTAIKALPGGQVALGQKLLDDGLVTAKDTIYTTSEKVGKALQASGEHLGALMQELDSRVAAKEVPALNGWDILDKAYQPVKQLMQNNANADQIEAAVKPKLNAFFNQYLEKALTTGDPAVKYADLHAFQASLRPAYEGADSVTKGALKALERGLSQQLESGVQKASAAAGVDTFSRYMGLKNEYRMLALAKDAAESGVRKAESGMMKGLAKTALRLGSAGAAVGSLASGHPVGALASTLGLAAPTVANMAQERGGNIVASLMNQASQSLPQSVPGAVQQGGRSALLEVLRQLGGQ